MNLQKRVLLDTGGGDHSFGAANGPDILRILRRRHRHLLATILIVMAAAVVMLLVIQPRYDATAVMRVDLDELDLPASQTTAASIRDAELYREHQIQTQIQLLSSRPVVRQAVRDLALHDDPEFNPQPAPSEADAARPRARGVKAGAAVVPPQVIERTTDRVLAALEVEQDGQSSFLNVTVTSTNPTKAARIANKITTTYIATQVAERTSARRRNIDTLSMRVQELRTQLVSTEHAIATYRRAYGIDTGAGSDANAAQMGRLASELASARGIRAETEARGGGPGQVMSPLLADLRGQETAVSRRLAELSTQYGRAHPDVQKAGAELAELRRGIITESGRIQGQLASETAAQRAKESRLAGDLGSMRSQSFERGITSVALADLERNADTTRTVYLGLLARLKDMRRQYETVKADASIASVALLPTQPSFPRVNQVLGAAAGAAIILGFIVVLLTEALDQQVRTASQVAALVELPTFGMIPEISQRRRQDFPRLNVLGRPHSSFAESVREVAARLARTLPRREGNVVLVTSPLPGDGKTTLAIAIAAATAATRQTSVIVDFDLRRPGLGGLTAPADGDRDLVDFLAGNATLDEIIYEHSTEPAIMTVPLRAMPSDPGEMLASPNVQALFDALRERFDLVIVNSPPILAVADAQALASHADAVLLVLRWGSTTADLLRSAVAQIDATLTAVVFNRVKFEQHARFAYGDRIQYFQKFSSYYRETDVPQLGGPRRSAGQIDDGASMAV